MQALLMMPKTHRPDLHTKLNVKRSNFFSFFQALILTCGQNAEIIQCRDFLGKFIRSPGTSFIECITTFDSIYCHWQQLLRPISRREPSGTSISTLRQITPFLLNDKCVSYLLLGQNSKLNISSPSQKRKSLM